MTLFSLWFSCFPFLKNSFHTLSGVNWVRDIFSFWSTYGLHFPTNSTASQPFYVQVQNHLTPLTPIRSIPKPGWNVRVLVILFHCWFFGLLGVLKVKWREENTKLFQIASGNLLKFTAGLKPRWTSRRMYYAN